MKEPIKHFFPLVLAVLCTTCGITLLFHTFDVGTAFSNLKQNTGTTSIAEHLNPLEKEPFPTLIYVGTNVTVGDANRLSDLFQLKTATGTLSALDAVDDTALYLIDVKSETGTSLLTTMSTTDIQNLEELPSRAIYDSDKQLLYFHQSGIYTLCVRFYYNHRPGVLFECRIPVETR